MDLRALAELIELSLVGLSALTIAVGFSVRVFLAPVVRDAAERLGSRSPEREDVVAMRLDHLGERLAALESAVERLALPGTSTGSSPSHGVRGRASTHRAERPPPG